MSHDHVSSESTGPSRRRRRRGGRGSRRAEAHRNAEAELAAAPPVAVPDHPLIPKTAAALVTDAVALDELVAHLRAAGAFAYDTEFIGEETYHPHICLIQLATRERVALVDPLAGLDVTPVWELIADPDVETIVHAGQQDLEPVVRHLGRPPAAIFDTQIAAGFAGLPYPLSLRRLLEELVGVSLGKGLTFTKWDHRPLSKAHARYAADDVRYLPAVRERLRDALAARDHTTLAEAEFAAMSDVERYRFDPGDRVERLVSNRKLKPRTTAILRELVVFRDETARAFDRPPRSVLPDDVLIRLSRDPARSVDALDRVKGLPRPLIASHGERIVEVTARALALPPGSLASVGLPEETTEDRVRIDGLWAIVSAYCLGRDIDPSLVGNRRRLAEYYFGRVRGDRSGSSRLDDGWRRELIGTLLEELLDGRARIRLAWTDGRLAAEAERGDEDGTTA